MYSVLIKEGRIVDGNNSVPYIADIAVKGDEIVKIGQIDEPAERVIDAKGKTVTPGFIDIHCHSDAIVFDEGKNPLRLRMGVTTEVIGNCGISAAPVNPDTVDLLRRYSRPFFSTVEIPYSWRSFGEYMDALEMRKPMLNTAPLMAHGTLRIATCGFDDRPLTGEEKEIMHAYLREGLEAGAFGFSSGLIYPPGVFADREELEELCAITASYGGIYATHMRSESFKMLEAVEEALSMAERTGVSLEISHHKVQGIMNWGMPKKSLGMIHQARDKGLEVNCDVYPYTGCSTTFSTILPPWVNVGGSDKLCERLGDAGLRKKIIDEMKTRRDYENISLFVGTWDKIYINDCECKQYEGKTVQELADEYHADPYELALDIIRESRNNVMMIAFTMDEGDLELILRDPCAMVCTDGFASLGPTHPRYTSAFVRVLEKYVKQEHLLSLPEAIYKMTRMPAEKIGLADRGVIAEGKKADLLVLDMDRLHDNADYQNYNAVADGIDYVMINGHLAVDQGSFNNISVGRVLRKNHN